MDNSPRVAAVIVAAGNSTRMSLGVSKQLLPLMGMPVIAHTLMAFERAESIKELVVVCRESDISAIEEIADSLNLTKLRGLALGGATRSESVEAGVHCVSEQVTHFAIHDGARALVLPEDIDRVVQSAIEHKAATLAVPVTDTIKVVDSRGVIVDTPDRATLYAAQTPQVFERKIYLNALNSSGGRGFTDDCSLVEQSGVEVHVVMGSYCNIKLTTPQDIPLAEGILKRRGEKTYD